MEETNKRRKQIMGQLKKKEAELVELERLPGKNKREIEECNRKIERLTKEKGVAEELRQANLLKLPEQIKPLTDKKEKLEAELVDVQVRSQSRLNTCTLCWTLILIRNHIFPGET